MIIPTVMCPKFPHGKEFLLRVNFFKIQAVGDI